MDAVTPQGRVQSSYYPTEHATATFNDLACLHATRGAEGIYRRMMAAANEVNIKSK